MTPPDDAFLACFGDGPEVRARAPGRVNLIGEHTDYSGGYVLPVALPLETRVALRRRGGLGVRALTGGDLAGYVLGEERPRRGWIDYVQGVTAALRARGARLTGFDVGIASTVPQGAGLSSSAALEVSLLRALRDAFALTLDDVDIARYARAAENDFVGAPVGIMDPMASSVGDEDSALFLDTRSLRFERVPLPPQVELVVVDSGVSHRHASGAYATRRAECARAAALLGVAELRDVGSDDLDRVARLPEPLGRRARHVVTENARVLEAVEALRMADTAKLGALFAASHESMRVDFEVSVPEVDRLVAVATADPDVYAARLTGGGFGGSVVALARRGAGRVAARRITSRVGGDTLVHVPVPDEPSETPR